MKAKTEQQSKRRRRRRKMRGEKRKRKVKKEKWQQQQLAVCVPSLLPLPQPDWRNRDVLNKIFLFEITLSDFVRYEFIIFGQLICANPLGQLFNGMVC